MEDLSAVSKAVYRENAQTVQEAASHFRWKVLVTERDGTFEFEGRDQDPVRHCFGFLKPMTPQLRKTRDVAVKLFEDILDLYHTMVYRGPMRGLPIDAQQLEATIENLEGMAREYGELYAETNGDWQRFVGVLKRYQGRCHRLVLGAYVEAGCPSRELSASLIPVHE
jgi:hypothetical protein